MHPGVRCEGSVSVPRRACGCNSHTHTHIVCLHFQSLAIFSAAVSATATTVPNLLTHAVCLHAHLQVFDGPGPETINSRLAMVSVEGRGVWTGVGAVSNGLLQLAASSSCRSHQPLHRRCGPAANTCCPCHQAVHSLPPSLPPLSLCNTLSPFHSLLLTLLHSLSESLTHPLNTLSVHPASSSTSAAGRAGWPGGRVDHRPWPAAADIGPPHHRVWRLPAHLPCILRAHCSVSACACGQSRQLTL